MFLKATTPLEKCQLKFASDEKTGEFEGYASVFNSNDSVGDTILPGAFKSTLDSGRKVKGFVNHQQDAIPVIDWKKLEEDERGLRAYGKIDLNHKDGPTLHSAMLRGAMDGLSIGFVMKREDFEWKDEEAQYFGGRNIKNMTLMEISAVNFPCEGQALISAVKADVNQLDTITDLERYLRDAWNGEKSAAIAWMGRYRDFILRDAKIKGDEISEQQVMAQIHSALSDFKSRIK